MQKYKLALILYSSAIGVFYGVTTASAAPLRNWAHDFVVKSATVVTQFVASSRDFDFKSGVATPTEPVIFTRDVADPIAVFVREIQLSYQTGSALLAAQTATRDVLEQRLGEIGLNAGHPAFASSLPQPLALNVGNDNPGRFVYQEGRVFPGAGAPSRPQPNRVEDRIADLGVPPPSVEDNGINPPDISKYPDESTWPASPILRLSSNTPTITDDSDPSKFVVSRLSAIQTIPEAATLALLGLGVAGLSFIRRRPA